MAEQIRAAALADLPEGSTLGVELLGERICLANIEGEVYAFQESCTHKEFPLTGGDVDDHEITCNWHGARFDVRTGRALCLPAVRPLRTYEVEVRDGEIFVEV